MYYAAVHYELQQWQRIKDLQQKLILHILQIKVHEGQKKSDVVSLKKSGPREIRSGFSCIVAGCVNQYATPHLLLSK